MVERCTDDIQGHFGDELVENVHNKNHWSLDVVLAEQWRVKTSTWQA